MTALGDARSGATASDIGELLSLRLYVAGDAPNSVEARTNLVAILESNPMTRYELEIVDFLKDPLRAMDDGVIVTPTLVRLAPPPTRKLIGTLRETVIVLAALGIPGKPRV